MTGTGITMIIMSYKNYSYLKAQWQVGTFIKGSMLIKIIEFVSHYYYSGGYAY